MITDKDIKAGKYYNEYTKEELAVLPPLNAEDKEFWKLGYDHDWYFDIYHD